MSRLSGILLLLGSLTLLTSQGVRGEPATGNKPAALEPAAAKDSHGDPLPRGARLRLGTIRFRHGGQVTSLRYLPDGKTLLSFGVDQVLRFWDAANGKELGSHTLPQNNNPNAMAASWCLSSDGRLLATIEASTVKLRELPSGKVAHQFKLDMNAALSVQFSADSKQVAAAIMENNNNGEANPGHVRVWDTVSGKELHRLVGPAPEQEGQARFLPQTVIFSADGKRLASVGTEFNNNNRIRIWDLTARDKEGMRLMEHAGTLGMFVLFSPDNKYLLELSANAITGGNAKLRLWDPTTGKQVRTLGEVTNGVTNLLFSPDGKRIAAVEAANNQAVLLWDTATGKELASIGAQNNQQALVFSPDGKTLAMASGDQTIHLHETTTGKELRQIKVLGNVNQNGNITDLQGLGNAIAFSTDGKTIAVAGNSVIRRWDAATGKEAQLPGGGHEDIVVMTVISPDGKTTATAGQDGLRLWDTLTGKETLRLPQPRKTEEGEMPPEPEEVSATAAAYSPDGKILAVNQNNGIIRLHDPRTGKELRRLEGHTNGLSMLAFTPDGKQLASASFDGMVFLWDVSSGKQLRQFAGPMASDAGPVEEQPGGNGPAYVAISPTGATLAVASGASIRIWELATGKARRDITVSRSSSIDGDIVNEDLGGIAISRVMRNNSMISDLAFAPDAKTLAAVVGDTIVLYDTARGKEIRQFGGQQGSVHGVTFAPNGKLVAGASQDGSIRLWETATGTVLAHLEGHRSDVYTLAFTPDGQTMASVSGDTTALLWDVKRCLEEKPRPTNLSAKELADIWNHLADEDGTKADDAIWRLVDLPKQSVPWLQQRLKPIPLLDKARLAKLITELEDERFDIRKRATDELEKLAELAKPSLEKRLADNPPLEVRQRVEGLLQKLTGPLLVPDLVRLLRAVEALEQIGTPEAQQVLAKLGQGAAESRITQKAKEALARLDKRPAE